MNIIQNICDARPSESEISNFEKTLEAALPAGYKLFLMNHNGGKPKPSKFSFISPNGNHEDSSVHYFFGLHNERIGNLLKQIEILRKRIPPKSLPIATDPFGNIILLRLANENHGNILFWNHEKEEDPPTQSNISFVAKSFEDFVSKLESV